LKDSTDSYSVYCSVLLHVESLTVNIVQYSRRFYVLYIRLCYGLRGIRGICFFIFVLYSHI